MGHCVGIRREDKSIWERRVPLIPDHVPFLRELGIEVVVQPSDTRVFKENEYISAGATIAEDLSKCPVVFAVKEIPARFFQKGGTYVFFSHTIKGQPNNMPMLKRLMELGCNLIDYERVVDDHNRRLVFFGWHAGVAGMVETLAAYGKRLASEGVASPLNALKQPIEYTSIHEAKTVLEVIREWIKTDGLPDEIVPFVVGVTGYGNVSRGAQEMLDVLPVKEILPSELKTLNQCSPEAKHTVYKVVFKEEDIVVPRRRDDPFSLQDYYDHPEKYEGIFEMYLPYLSVLVNCIFWTPRYPRLVSKEYLKNKWQGTKLRAIGDISCDIDGSIEATAKVTDPSNPTYVWDPATGKVVDGWEGNGPVIMAIDFLPAELPRDASVYFSNVLKEFVPAITLADYGVEFEHLALPDPIKKALVLHRGKLTPEYQYLEEFLK
jgi:saccharopine dehydrogenase (NAD+, L-lysine-forming)